MSDHYILNEDHSVTPVDLMTWAVAFNDMSKRRMALDKIGDASISTVFLGLDHSFGDGPPLIFETLISGGALDQEMWRYSTWDEAVAGHQRAVAQAIEAQRAATGNTDAVADESAVPKECARKGQA